MVIFVAWNGQIHMLVGRWSSGVKRMLRFRIQIFNNINEYITVYQKNDNDHNSPSNDSDGWRKLTVDNLDLNKGVRSYFDKISSSHCDTDIQNIYIEYLILINEKCFRISTSRYYYRY